MTTRENAMETIMNVLETLKTVNINALKPTETKEDTNNKYARPVIEERLSSDEAWGIPTLKITGIDRFNNVFTGYLSLFRCYCFQVSGSPEGDGDYGASDVSRILTNTAHDPDVYEGRLWDVVEREAITACIECFRDIPDLKSDEWIKFITDSIAYLKHHSYGGFEI